MIGLPPAGTTIINKNYYLRLPRPFGASSTRHGGPAQ